MSGEAARAADIRAEQEAQERADLVEEIEATLSGAFDNHGQAGTTWVGEREHPRCECGFVDPHIPQLGDHQLRMAAEAVADLIGRLP